MGYLGRRKTERLFVVFVVAFFDVGGWSLVCSFSDREKQDAKCIVPLRRCGGGLHKRVF